MDSTPENYRELPHLSMHLRRWSNRPLRLILIVPSLFALMFWLKGRYPDFFGTYLGGNLDYIFILLGNLVVYWIIAQMMAGLARDPGGRAPAWYMSPIENGRALLGICLAALLAALMPLLSLGMYLVFSVRMELSDNPSSAPFYELFYPHLFNWLLRLPHFALLCGCVLVVFRRSIVFPLLPLLLALTATSMQFWDISLYPFIAEQNMMEQSFIWTTLLTLSGFLLLTIILAALRHASRNPRFGLQHALALLALLALPLGMGVISSLPQFMPASEAAQNMAYLLESWQNIPLHACYAQVFPDVYQVTYDMSGSYASLSPFRYVYYGSALPRATAIMLLAGMHLLALGMWWETALYCLQSARQPQRRPRVYPRDFLSDEDEE